MKKLLLTFLILVLSLPVFAQPLFDKIDKRYEELSQKTDKNYQDYKDRQDAIWRAWVAKIEAKWNEFEDSTKKKWVDYSDNIDAKSRVEFEDGYIEVEAIVPADNPKAQQEAEKLISAQMSQIFSDNNPANQNVLDGMVDMGNQNVEQFIKQDVTPNIKKIDTFKSKDGITRDRFTIRVKMVSNHMKKRAKRYLPIVKANCDKYGLDVSFVLALIHTESAFNPLAKSWADAYGLMQLIPRYGALEGYEFLYGEKKRVSPEYLYNPENNIALGTAYLYLLFTRYFGYLDTNLKKRHCAIAGYNWGPGRVKKHITNSMTERQVYDKIKSVAPKETQDYLDRITARIPQYEEMSGN